MPRHARRRATNCKSGWLGLEPLESRHLLTAVPLITEIMAANDGVLADADGDNSDWIELGNAGDQSIDLAGWYLTDSPGNLHQWALPTLVLDPGDYAVVFASGKNRTVAGQELHANFSLAADGEYLALVRPDGVTVASQFAPQFPPQRSNVSYGLRTDGGGIHAGEFRYYTTPTPGSANGDGYLGIVDTPTISLQHGFYSGTQTVSISETTPGAVVHYTLDGTEPTESTGTIYSGPLSVSHTTVLRTAAFRGDYLPSNVATSTYLFKQDVMTQTRPGSYPTTWGTAPPFPVFGLPSFLTPADYDVDPEVVNNPAYTADFLAGLTSIPSVSVVMNPSEMFGPNGIYANPWERGDLWERATSMELINPDGTPGFQIDAGARILGNASRQPMLSPKHSLRIDFRSQYGPSELDYPLFGTDTVTKFDSIVLRAELSDSWVSPQGASQVLTFVGTQGRPRAQYARDNFARETQLAMGQLAPQSNYVHLFINGLYWGLYDLIERRDEDFVAAHEGGVPEDYDVLQDDVFGDSGTVVQGDTVAWDAMFALANAGLANDAQYQQIQQYLDIDKFIDYMNLHLYVGSQDWPYNNWTAMRKRDGGKFEFFTWDAEYTLQDPTTDRTGVNDANSPGQLFAALRTNLEFRLKFADRAQYFLFDNGLLTPSVAAARYSALIDQIEDAVVDESARWGDYRRDVHPFLAGPYELSTRDNQWVAEKNRMLNTYFPTRTANVINQYIVAGLFPTLAAPSFNQHGGAVANGFALTMSAAGTIYYTLDGSDPRLSGGAISPTATQYTGAVTLSHSAKVNARVFSGGVWSALETATFTVDVPALRITELMYHPAPPPPGGAFDKDEFEFIEVQNVGATTLNLQGVQLASAVNFTFPNTMLAPGQYAVVVENAAAFASRYGTGINVVGQYTGKLDNSGELVTLRDAFAQTIQSFAYLDDDWYPSTDGAGHSLVIRDALAPPAAWGQQAGWRPSTNLQGSPGAADPLVVTRQLFYNQSHYDGQTAGISAADDGAIAIDKAALLPGGTATFANVSSYTRGINGIMVDIAATLGTLSASDFIFRVGNNNAPSTWGAAPPPLSISVRAGAGVNGSDRVELIWANGAISKQWLEVIVRANGNTQLPQLVGFPAGQGDVFFFGNAPGDSGQGDTATQATVSVSDELAARNHPASLFQNIPITNPLDYNRDGSVNLTDALVPRNQPSNLGNVLRLLSLSQPPAAPEEGEADRLALAAVAVGIVNAEQVAASEQPPAPRHDGVARDTPQISAALTTAVAWMTVPADIKTATIDAALADALETEWDAAET